MANSRLCSISDCGKTVKNCGLCNAHYKRLLRHGDPLAGRTSKGEPHRFLNDVVIPYQGDECILWPFSKTPSGYGQIRIDGSSAVVSRVVCEIAHGKPNANTDEAAHECNNGHLGCVTKGHLSWKTRTENEADKIANGTSNRGERCGASKITAKDVTAIRLLLGTMPQKDIATMFGVSRPHITAIKKRTVWDHLI